MLLTEPLLLLLFYRLAGSKKVYDSQLEPGHLKPDYDSVEEVKGHENETKAEKPTEDEHLTREAILDVAYYLRRFKFSGHDPRYLAEGEIPKQNLFVEFPSPPLRNIHWEDRVGDFSNATAAVKIKDSQLLPRSSCTSKTYKIRQNVTIDFPEVHKLTPGSFFTADFVKKNCEPSFVECVKYLQEHVTQTVLPRHLDSLTITKQNGWSFITDRDLIKAADDECRKLLEKDEKTFNVFPGPLQRFQWLTSASYYMCLYTMKENPYLRNFTDDCDNFASCIQWEFGLNNEDIRGNNDQPFACAFYSFCPDPCCPLKYLPDQTICWKMSPCDQKFADNITCAFSRNENTHFESIILNRWNVSCYCDAPGMRWESKSGLCVDINECTEMKTPCATPNETCINLPGKYKCECSPLGYRKNEKTQACERDPILHKVFYPSITTSRNETKSRKYYNKFQNFLRKFKSVVSVAFSSLEAEPDKNSYVEHVPLTLNDSTATWITTF